ncbi:MAG TPA: OsmC family protein [Croceibacterium sp.]|nr:OsmC family protein [Croceibacterium sp.]
MLDIAQTNRVNGIDLDALAEATAAIQEDPANGILGFRVRTEWTGQTRSETTIDSCTMGGERIARRHKIVADEPYELLGTDSAPNPQELLMSAVNACMVVGYVAQAAVRGITLTACRIEMQGELDLRGFLGLDTEVPNGYRQLDYVVTLEGDGTRAQYEDIHAAVQATSPNFYNINRTIEMNGRLA